jgi:hypothetical protein
VRGPAVTTRQLAGALGRTLGKELRIVEIPAAAHVDVLQGAGLPREMAESVAEAYALLSTRSIEPAGDRIAGGATSVDEILRLAVR